MKFNGVLIAIPDWLKDSYKLKGFNLKDCITLSELLECYTKEDVINLVTINQLLKDGKYVDSIILSTSLFPYVNTLKPVDLIKVFSHYELNSDLLNDIEKNALVKLKTDKTKALSDRTEDKLIQLMKGVIPNEDSFSNKYVPVIFHIENELFGLTFEELPSEYSNEDLTNVSNNIKELCKEYKYEDVCNTTLMQHLSRLFLSKC